MNNDLTDLYENNENKIQESSNNEQSKILNNPQDLSSLYGNTSTIEGQKEIKKEEKQDNDIHLNQEGLSKLYNNEPQTLTDDLTDESSIPNDKEVITPTQESAPTPITQNYKISEDDLLQAYVGKNIEKIATKPLNFSAFFFNVFYLLYRKKIIFAIIYSFLLIFLQFFINPLLLNIGLSILLAFSFNSVYISQAKNKIEKIKKRNPNASLIDIQNICSKVGRTSVLYIFLIIPISIILSIFSLFLQISFNLKVQQSSFSINQIKETISHEVSKIK